MQYFKPCRLLVRVAFDFDSIPLSDHTTDCTAYAKISSLYTISVTRLRMLFILATHSIWLVALRSSVIPSAVALQIVMAALAPNADIGRLRKFYQRNVVFSLKYIGQVEFGSVGGVFGFFHLVFLLFVFCIFILQDSFEKDKCVRPKKFSFFTIHTQ